MKNKKGFTLVELLAVIVILALIMGVAIVGIGNVISSSKNSVMLENALNIIDGVKKQFAIYGVEADGTYSFGKGILESGGEVSPLGGNFVYGTSSDGTAIANGALIWKYTTAPTSCTATKSYIKYDSTNGWSICLAAGSGNKYVDGTEAAINSDLNNKTTNTIKG